MALWIHPTVVHFAIGLLLAGLAFDVVGLWRTREKLLFAGYWNTLAGAVAVLAAAGTGLYSEAHLGPHSSIGNALLSFHKLFGIIVTILATLIATWRIAMRGYIQPRFRFLYLTASFFAAGLVFVTGTFGGALVYMYGLGLQQETLRRVLEAKPAADPADAAPVISVLKGADAGTARAARGPTEGSRRE